MRLRTSLWSPKTARAASITVVCLLITVLALTACGAADDSDEPGASSAEGDQTLATGSPDVGGPDPRTVEPAATIELPGSLNGLVMTDDAVWTGTPEGITRVDPMTNRAGAEVPVSNLAGYFTLAFGSAWVSDYDASLVRRVDPDTGKVLAEIPTGENPEGIGHTSDAVWVANHHSGSVTRIDPATNKAVATIVVGREGIGGPQQLLAADETVWVGVPSEHAVVRIDAATNEVDAVPVRGGCGNLFLRGDHLWVGGCDYSVDVVDVRTHEDLGRIVLAGQGGSTFEYQDRIWMTVLSEVDGEPGHLIAIDPTTLEVEDSIELESSTYPAALGFDSVWVAMDGTGRLLRLPLDSLEPR